MSRTLIVALNPSIDAEWRVADAQWEEKNNVRSERRWAGGKGINVARWLKHLGGRPLLLLPLGGKAGDELAGYLRKEKIRSLIIPLREPTRVNVIVTTDAGRQMRFNPAGPMVARGEWNLILATVKRELARVELLVLSGSLPRGVPVSAYAQLIRLARKRGVRTLLDCEGAALAAALKARPFLVKPNEHELGQWWGERLDSRNKVIEAAQALSKRTRGWVFLSRGASPSLLVNALEGFQKELRPPRIRPRNTVGAGDALLAGVAQAILRRGQPDAWLAAGVKTGSAATRCLPGYLPVN